MKFNISVPKVLFFLLALSLSVMIYTSSFFNIFYDEEFYEDFYERNEINQTLDVPTDKAMEIVAYLNSETDQFPRESPVFADAQFTDNEVSHFRDVKDLIIATRVVYFVSFTLFLVLIFGFLSSIIRAGDKASKDKIRRFLIKLHYYVIGITGSILLLFLIGTLSSFDTLFVWFHEIFFPQGNWQFPPGSLSITLFPSEFFYEFFMALLRNVFMLLSLLIVLVLFIRLAYRNDMTPSNKRKEDHKAQS